MDDSHLPVGKDTCLRSGVICDCCSSMEEGVDKEQVEVEVALAVEVDTDNVDDDEDDEDDD